MSIFLLGPPGSGKGTYGALLSKALSLPLLTASSILSSSPAFKKDYIDAGRLGPDPAVEAAVRGHLQERGYGSQELTEVGWYAKSYLLDGYPRTRGQHGLMAETWKRGGVKPPALCVHVDLPEEHCVKKIGGRVECAECGAVSNLEAVGGEGEEWDLPAILPTFGRTFCGACGSFDAGKWDGRYGESWMKRRPDDADEEVVRRRMEEYRRVTEPILKEVDPDRVVRFVPYRGVKDFGKLEGMVRERLEELEDDDPF